MNEKEKMLSGELYNPMTAMELFYERTNAKTLCHKFNNLLPSETHKRKSIIKKLFGKTGDNFHIESVFWCDYGYNIEIGENFYMNHNCTILDCAKVKFGDNVFVAPNCGFYTAAHPIIAQERNTGIEYAKPITIEDNVWIGGGCSFLPGVSVGANSVIGAGSVVTKDIPANVVAVGNPCRVLREITDADKCENKL